MPIRRIKKSFKTAGKFIPDEFLDDVVPARVWKKNFLTGGLDNLKVQKRIVKTLVASSAITQKDLTATITNVLVGYKRRGHLLAVSGIKAYKAEAINNEVLLKQRVRDAIVTAQVKAEAEKHAGEYYRWLPSAAENPDPEHQVLYGQIFRVGEGDKDGNMPGERFGCQCGIEWLKESE